MSIINQMLKDLDKRHQSHQLENIEVVANQATAEGTSNKAIYALVSLVVVLLIGGTIGVYFFWQKKETALEIEIATLRHQQVKDSAEIKRLENIKQESENQSVITNENNTENVAENSTNTINHEQSSTKDTRLADVAVKQTSAENPTTEEVKPAQETEMSVKLASDNQLEQDVDDNQDPNSDSNGGSMSVTPVSMSPKELARKHLNNAINAEQKGQFGSAEIEYHQALRVVPNLHKARENLAALYFGVGDLNKAKDLLEQGIILYPKQYVYVLLLARIQQEQGAFLETLATLKMIPDTSDFALQKWAHEGDIAQKVKQYDVSEDAYRKLLRRESEQARWWLGLAYAIDFQGRYDEAARAYKKALSTSGISSQGRQFIESRLVQLGVTQ